MPPSADLIVENASILTMDPDTPRAEAIAIKGGEIIAVGRSRDRAASTRGPARASSTPSGGSVVPGFIEAHMHLFAGAAELDHLQLSGVHGFDALCRCGAQLCRRAAGSTRAAGARRRLHHPVGDRAGHAAIISTASCRPALRRWRRPTTTRCGRTPRRWNWPACCRGKRLGPGNEIVMGDDGLADGELREGEAFGPLIALAGEEPCAARPGHRRRAGPEADAGGAGLRPGDHAARAGMVRQARHHLDPEHGRQSAPARTAGRDRGRGRACCAGCRCRSTTRIS